MKKAIMIVSWLCIGISVLVSFVDAQDNQGYGYAYIMFDEQGVSETRVINPQTGELVAGFSPQLVPVGHLLVDVTSDSNGQWIALALFDSNESSGFLRLYNNVTQEVRDISLQIVFSFVSDLRWSDNGQAISFLAYDTALERQTPSWQTYVYSVEINMLNLVRPYVRQTDVRDVYWSPDSSRFAVAIYDCRQSNTSYCETLIEIYAVDGTLLDSMSFNTFDDDICELEWSPDLQYISFIFSCFGTWSEWVRDVYVWDISSSIVNPVTNFTQSIVTIGSTLDTANPYWATYDTFWYLNTLGNSQLVISYVVGNFDYVQGFDPDTFAISTSAFSTNGIETPIDLHSIQDWTPAPVEDISVYNHLGYTLDTTQPSVDQLIIQNTGIEIGIFDGNIITPLQTISELGCEFDWSPDGAYIKYQTSDNNCRGATNTFSFIDRDSGLLTQHIYPLSDIRPIGWVTLPLSNN